MIQFVRQSSRENTSKTTKSLLKKKGESNDSGTESGGDILDVEKHRHLDLDMETGLSSCVDANSPRSDTACSESDASSAMMCQSHLLYDQHSSEEELEVINGPSSVAAAEAAATSCQLAVRGTVSSLISERGSSSLEADELFAGDSSTTTKRCCSTLIENRKRSLAHSSDDELRNFLEPILTPVNFRTSPPLEAFKPNKSHMFGSTTPQLITEASCGIENIKLCDNSVNDENGESRRGATAEDDVKQIDCNASCALTPCDDATSSLKMSSSIQHIYQPQAPPHNLQYNSSRSSPASITGLDTEVRSVSPPAKVFHCAISPRRRPMRNTQHHATQRLQRPHRPCLDFDKMQQVSL